MLSLACRWGMWLAERLVPYSLRDAWREDWRGDFWDWTLRPNQAGTPDSRNALLEHTRRAFVAAVQAQFHSDQGTETWLSRIGDPRFCLVASVIPLLAVTIFSYGFSDSRRL